MKEYICTHCGGHILPHSMKCEYCGTRYKVEEGEILRIETFQNPVETFTAVEAIPEEMLYTLGAEKAGEMALHHLSQKLAKCIVPMMQIETRRDYQHFLQEVRATIKIVRPEKRGKVGD